MKKFLRTPWGIVCIIAAALTLLGCAALTANQIWYYTQAKFQSVTVELGTQQVEKAQFCTRLAQPQKVSFVTKITEDTLGTTGEVPVTLRHGRKEETVMLKIVDTTPPAVEFITHRSEPSGYVPVPEDFVASVADLSETVASFAEQPQIPDDYRDLELTVVVADVHGNATRQQCVVSYTWMYEAVTLELGQTLTPAHILLEPEKDAQLLDEEELTNISQSGVGQYAIRCTSGGHTMECAVTVVDTTAPALELQSVSIYPNGRVKLEDLPL